MSESLEVDVLIVGAGISGIGAAYYLQKDHPKKSYAIVEARGAIGGTWDLFRYPGIRSDSDLYTFGYEFKPWTDEKVIASGDAILSYVRETAAEFGIDKKVRFGVRVMSAAWSTQKAQWAVELVREGGERVLMTCRFLFCASGYYRYDKGYTPAFAGVEKFKGQVIHPQQWPADLDYANKRVVIIGSGATAVTLAPALSNTAAHVIMLQRTPSYIVPAPSKDKLALQLQKILPLATAHEMARRKNIAMQRALWVFCRKFPVAARRLIRSLNASRLPKGYAVDEHFNPPYNPWDQRLCVVPNSDLFRAISKGAVEVVTDHVETFTENGLRLKSGRELEADIIVTATGLNLLGFGGISFSIDGVAADLRDKVAFRGMMLSGIPNFAFALGYTNASWTLKVGLLCQHFCRILSALDAQGSTTFEPRLDDPHMPTHPLLDFGAGYVKRSIDDLPRQGEAAPWLMPMNYYEDRKTLRKGPVVDRYLVFSRPSAR